MAAGATVVLVGVGVTGMGVALPDAMVGAGVGVKFAVACTNRSLTSA